MTFEMNEEVKEHMREDSDASILYIEEAKFLPQPYSLVQKPSATET